jgi:hypothetical protein
MKTRHDSQKSGMAGEFLVAGKLFKRGYQVAVTMGNAKAIDLFVHNTHTSRTFNVQVKAVHHKNCFPMRKEAIIPSDVYAFVILNDCDQDEDYFLLFGSTLLADIDRFFGSSYRGQTPSSMPAVNYGPLKDFKDNWKVFDQQEASTQASEVTARKLAETQG